MSRPLAPAHREDLTRSGLTEATIAALRFEAVRPADIPVAAAESAYSIPYFNLDGTANCFARLRLIPAVTDRNGRGMKYYQAPDTSPHLYLPPLVDWRSIATNAALSVVITEGEKKAAAACQAGLPTAGIGGVWCWTSTLDDGRPLTLPMLDEFLFTNRLVEICPDSDAWRPDQKGQTILAGFFALAKTLQSRGATVRFVVLPDANGAKAGLDDWLLVPGNDLASGWPRLERLPLDHPRFDTLNAWHQRWKEQQATREALRQRESEQLTVSETAGLYTVRAPQHRVTMTFDRLTDVRGGVTAEVQLVLGATELIGGVDLGLKSDTGHTKLAQSLKAIAPTVPWKLLLQRACSLVLTQHRRGEPLQRLTQATPVEALSYALNPLVFRGKPTILFGDGGLGKSSLALLCAMLVSIGGSLAGLRAVPGRALYLDYEDDADVHARRLQALIAGHPELAAAEVAYLRCTEPLARMVAPLVRRLQEEGITFLVLDSLIAATGGDASAEATAKLFAALRVLNVSTLALGHVPKSQPEGIDRATVYGSVFFKNLSRSVWELQKEQDLGSEQSILGLFHRKSNLSRLQLPLTLKVTQDADGTLMQYEPIDMGEASALATALPLANRIRNLLDDGTPRTAREIGEELGAPLPSVKATLSKHAGRKWQMLGGVGRETNWTVLAPQNES